MFRSTTTRALCATAILTIMGGAACGGDDGDNQADAGNVDAAPDAPVQSTALDPICNETDGLFIELFGKLFQCNPLFRLFIGYEIDDAELSTLCYGSFQPFVDDGTITIGTDLAACRAYIANTSCELYDLDTNPCDGIINGTVAAGDDCDISDQCAGDNYCNKPVTGCGSCTARVANNQACAEGDECQSNHCNAALVCTDKGAISDTCADNDDCIGQLVCDTSLLTCASAPVFQVNDVCDNTDFLACGFPFTEMFCNSANLCAAESEVGQMCDNVDTRCHILDYEWCNAGTCAGPMAAVEGAVCNTSFDAQTFECEAGLVCTDFFNGGTCVSPQQDGQACVDVGGADPDNECSFFLNCVEGTCSYSEHTGECPAP